MAGRSNLMSNVANMSQTQGAQPQMQPANSPWSGMMRAVVNAPINRPQQLPLNRFGRPVPQQGLMAEAPQMRQRDGFYMPNQSLVNNLWSLGYQKPAQALGYGPYQSNQFVPKPATPAAATTTNKENEPQGVTTGGWGGG